MKLRGFSLIEVAVASAIAGIIGVASISAFAVLNRQLVVVQREAIANDIAKGTVDVLVSSVQGAGGGPVRPHMAVLVTDGAAGTPDALSLATLIEDAPICTIQTASTTEVTVGAVSSVCCLTDLFTAAGGSTNIEGYLVNGAVHRQVKLSAGRGCSAEIQPGVMAALDSPAVSPLIFAGGSIAAVTVKSISLNDTELRITQQLSPPPAAQTITLISDDVFDFQVQLGFDRAADGRIFDTLSDGDEWQYNTVSDPDTFTPSDLRMIGVGVVVGVASQRGATSVARVVGGLTQSSSAFFLRSAMGRATFRNVFVFN
jgi:prepilin-type N-terminal cleavage/methylation domain-containing protein